VVFFSGCDFSNKNSRDSQIFDVLPKPKRMTITLNALDDANENTAVAVDVIYTISPELTEKLSNMTAREYFKMRDQLIRDYVNMVLIHSWELPPGHTVKEEALDLHPKTTGAFIFADYDIPGTYRARLPLFENLYVHLKRSDFKVMTY
jgi:hypothetical protein